ncbi:MAG: phage tail protein [Elainellaceae cyanobacterium]
MTDFQLIEIGGLPEASPTPFTGYIPLDISNETKKLSLGVLRNDILNDAALTGAPTAPTPLENDNSTKIATTEFVQTELGSLGLNPATSSEFGTVRTNSTDSVPIVYLKSETDALVSATKPVSEGGTGSTTASGARSNLEAAKSGVNNDITELQALTQTPSAVQASINVAVPKGCIMLWPTANAPGGWLFCQGQTLDRTTYAGLFAVIGTTFGNGDGTGNTFSLPDLRGRVVLGAGISVASGTDRAIASTGGADESPLSNGQMPSHDHGSVTQLANTDHYHSGTTSTTGNHSHLMGVANNRVGGGSFEAARPLGSSVFGEPTGNHAHTFTTGFMQGGSGSTHSHALTSEGNGDPVSRLQPFMALNFIIKV